MRHLAGNLAAVTRTGAVRVATAPLDIRAGTETALAPEMAVFGAAHARHAYVFHDRRASRLQVLARAIILWHTT